MLSTLFLVAGTSLSCVYGIKENKPNEGYGTPSFEETPCVFDGQNYEPFLEADDSFSFERVVTSGDGINESVLDEIAWVEAVNPTRVVQTSTKLTKLENGDAHKDIYSFSTREKLRFDFSITNAPNYKFQI